MQIRLMGTQKECQACIDTMQANQELILEISRFYPNRGNSKLVRCYINATVEFSERPIETERKEITSRQDQEYR